MKTKITITIAILFTFLIVMISACKKPEDTATGVVVINELMPVNSTTAADQNGQYDDWIELYNKSQATVDMSGYCLSDNSKKNLKWRFPGGTSISGNGYLIIWADEDTTQAGLHANFKLSSNGEEVVLSIPDGRIIDQVTFPAQTLELSYSRVPNGSGPFRWVIPTFDRNNDSK
jgi:hypothetical protein